MRAYWRRIAIVSLMSAIVFGFEFLWMANACLAQSEKANLTIRLKNDTKQFRMGEIIPVELSFSASIPETYEMETNTYDRSGRLGFERFIVDPEGRDPLHSHYAEGLHFGFAGGGISAGPKRLTSTPEVIVEDLNEYVALDKPGHYTLYVSSTRVHRINERFKTESWEIEENTVNIQVDNPVDLRSNTVEFDIIEADAAWREAQLTSALATLGNLPIQGNFPLPPGPASQNYESAMKILRYLDSPGSIRELVKRIMNPNERRKWDCRAGLIGSRFQDKVLQELESQLKKPDTALTADYLAILAQTRFLQTEPPYSPDSVESYKERADKFADFTNKLYKEANELVRIKQGVAKAETISALLQHSGSSNEGMQTQTGISAESIAASFPTLPPRRQFDLLNIYWNNLKSPAMVPALEAILNQPVSSLSGLRESALKRLSELDVEKARPYILAEIRQPLVDGVMGLPIATADTLGRLPDRTLPEFDKLLAKRFADLRSRTQTVDAGLIDRYATSAILPEIKGVIERVMVGQCDIADSITNYLLRVDPEYGISVMIKEPRECTPKSYKTLHEIGRFVDVEPGVIELSKSPELFKARQAAEMLGKYGGVEAKKALFEYMRRFHEEWSGRENELSMHANMSREASEANMFQSMLVSALGQAGNWILSSEEIDELENLVIGSQRQTVAGLRWKSPVRIFIHSFNDLDLRFSVAALYNTDNVKDLCNKLTQFPKDTVFRMSLIDTNERIVDAVSVIRDFALDHGLMLKDSDPEPVISLP